MRCEASARDTPVAVSRTELAVRTSWQQLEAPLVSPLFSARFCAPHRPPPNHSRLSVGSIISPFISHSLGPPAQCVYCLLLLPLLAGYFPKTRPVGHSLKWGLHQYSHLFFFTKNHSLSLSHLAPLTLFVLLFHSRLPLLKRGPAPNPHLLASLTHSILLLLLQLSNTMFICTVRSNVIWRPPSYEYDVHPRKKPALFLREAPEGRWPLLSCGVADSLFSRSPSIEGRCIPQPNTRNNILFYL